MKITNVRPWGGAPRDITIDDGVVTAIEPAARPGTAAGNVAVTADTAAGDLDGAGRLLVPSFTDAHVHLDSTRLGLPFRSFTGGATVLEQVMNDRENWRSAEKSVADRATYTLGLSILSGATRARSYAQIDSDCRLERFEGVLAARAAHEGRADVEVIAFPQSGIIRDPATEALLDEALASGADTVGGIDPCAIDQDPRGQIDVVFALAEKHGVFVDIHLHEPGELGLFTLGLIVDRVRALDYRGRVTVSHAFSLADAPDKRLNPLLDHLAALDIALTTIAPTPERALPLLPIVERGIRLGLGQDGQRDYWSPYGSGDMLDRTWQLAWTNSFKRDADFETCLAIASIGGASIMPAGRPAAPDYAGREVAIGDAADFAVLEGETLTSAVLDRLPGRSVVHEGRLVVDRDRFVTA